MEIYNRYSLLLLRKVFGDGKWSVLLEYDFVYRGVEFYFNFVEGWFF